MLMGAWRSAWTSIPPRSAFRRLREAGMELRGATDDSCVAMRYIPPEPMPDKILWRVQDHAIRAPNGTSRQGWAFAVRDVALRLPPTCPHDRPKPRVPR